jgi:hypothetical protein
MRSILNIDPADGINVLDSGFASRRFAACLLTPLRRNDEVGILPTSKPD